MCRKFRLYAWPEDLEKEDGDKKITKDHTIIKTFLSPLAFFFIESTRIISAALEHGDHWVVLSIGYGDPS